MSSQNNCQNTIASSPISSNIHQHRLNKVTLSLVQVQNWQNYRLKILEADTKNETEEHQKKIFNDFLKDSFGYDVNTNGKQDNAIYNQFGTVEVIIEWKQISKNKKEMPTLSDLNKKALQQSLYYYLQETQENKSIKHIIVSNGKDFLIWDGADFEEIFGGDKKLKKDFAEYELKQGIYKNTDQFYEHISKPAIDRHLGSLKDKVIAIDWDSEYLPKLFAPAYLLKKTPININSLNEGFYGELLYIMGLEEKPQNGIIKIVRLPQNTRQQGSLLENVLLRAESFEVGFEIIVTWLNRILFLKLLEGQILDYNDQDKAFMFLTKDKVGKYRDLKRLFFDVLAVQYRNPTLTKGFENVPYLNSSLFLETNYEKQFGLQELGDDYEIKIYDKTILKTDRGDKKTGSIKGLDYLLGFLEAYNFSKVKNQESTANIINSSVLGSFFEKLNGYKDGSFYTPSTITEYISQTCLQKVILHKFDQLYGLKATDIKELRSEIKEAIRNKTLTRQQASGVLSNLKIVDPAVGSGYFLVSCLNQILYFKSRLGLLLDKNDDLLDCDVEIENDELTIYQNGKKYHYYANIPSSAIIQESLFLEKQNLIENCIFGVDINPNSVKICQLRLWIELLKNTYYKADGYLQTLPNIDINIKCGNSVLSRFETSQDISKILQNISNSPLEGWTQSGRGVSIAQYKQFFVDYQTAKTKQDRQQAEQNITSIKNNLGQQLSEYSPINTKIKLLEKGLEDGLVEIDTKQKAKITKILEPLLLQKQNIEQGSAYKNAFEWRFEFPQVLDDEGRFLGFDLVIGNPPYIGEKGNKDIFDPIKSSGLGVQFYQGKMDLFYFFFHLGLNLTKENGLLGFITTNYYITATGGSNLRKDIQARSSVINMVNFGELKIFESATGQHNLITILEKTPQLPSSGKVLANVIVTTQKGKLNHAILHSVVSGTDPSTQYYYIPQDQLFKGGNICLTAGGVDEILEKMLTNTKFLGEICDVNQGVLSGADTLTDKHIEKFGNLGNKGDGIFVLDLNNSVDFEFYHSIPEVEKGIIKPFYKNSNIEKYKTISNPTKYIIYITKKTNITNYPTILKHLEKFKLILQEKREAKTGSLPWYSLHWSRNQNIFEGYKIIVPYRSLTNTFGYSNNSCYFRTDAYSIISNNQSYTNKLLLGILNSRLIYKWLKFRGKNKGENLELFTEPLSKIPIPTLDTAHKQELARQIEALVEQILMIKNNPVALQQPLNKGQTQVSTAEIESETLGQTQTENSPLLREYPHSGGGLLCSTTELESQIDTLVYQLYDLTAEEITVVEM